TLGRPSEPTADEIRQRHRGDARGVLRGVEERGHLYEVEAGDGHVGEHVDGVEQLAWAASVDVDRAGAGGDAPIEDVDVNRDVDGIAAAAGELERLADDVGDPAATDVRTGEGGAAVLGDEVELFDAGIPVDPDPDHVLGVHVGQLGDPAGQAPVVVGPEHGVV